MIKFPNIDALMKSEGWAGLIARCAVVLIFYTFLRWLPEINTWSASTFHWHQVGIDERRQNMAIYLTDFLLILMIVFSGILAFKLMRKRKK